jgi:hypothetical protein
VGAPVIPMFRSPEWSTLSRLSRDFEVGATDR